MRRWLAVSALVVLPMIAHAECGWLLMMPTSLSREVESNTARIVTPPMSSWTQISAFDGAERCEDHRGALIADSRKRLPDSSDTANQVKIGKYWDLTQDQQAYMRWSFSRCLPASVVPVK